MPIYEFGYRHWEGTSTPRWWRWWPISRVALQLALKTKGLRISLILLTLGALAAGIPFFGVSQVAASPPDHTSVWHAVVEMFVPGLAMRLWENPELQVSAWSSMFAMLWGSFLRLWVLGVVMMAGPALIANDVRGKAFLLYFSKPITRWDYLGGKVVALAGLAAIATTVPSLALALESAALASTWSMALQACSLFGRVLLASVATIFPAVTAMLVLSSFCRDARYAQWTFAVICFVGEAFYNILVSSGVQEDWIFLCSPAQTMRVACWEIFQGAEHLKLLGIDARGVQALAPTYPAGQAFAVLGALTAGGLFLLQRRVTAPVRI